MLSEANLNKVSKILQVSLLDIEAQISWMGARFTSQIQTDIESELERWNAVSGGFIDILPMEKNYGVKITADRAKDDIRANLAILFYRKDWSNSGSNGAGQISMVRG